MRSNNVVPFQGIVAVGNSKDQAVNNYRLLAMGKGVACYVDQQRTVAFVSNAASEMDNVFNPQTGNMDLEQSPDTLQGLEYEARAADEHEAYHHQCNDGCGMHLVFDSLSFVSHCPVCTTAIAASEDEESEDELDEEIDNDSDAGEDEGEDEADIEADDEESEEDEESDEDTEDAGDEDESEETEDDESDDSDDNTEDDEESTVDEPIVVAASSRAEAMSLYAQEKLNGMSDMSAVASAETTAHYVICTAADCGAHVISDEEVHTCPNTACASELEEPTDLDEDEEVEVDLDEEESDAGDDEDDGDDVDLTLLDSESADDEDGDDEEDTSDEDEGAEDEEESDEDTSEDEDTSDEDTGADDEEEDTSDEDDTSEDEDDQSGEDEDEEDDATDVEIDTLDELDNDASVDDLDVSLSTVAGQPTWTAFYKGVPVAMATAASVDKSLHTFFNTPKFGTVALASAKIKGVKPILTEMGFRGIAATMQVDAFTMKAVAAATQEKLDAVAAEQAAYTERFNAALATAAVGITRGFFKDQSNPVRDALASALAAAGVQNPEILVDNALRVSFEPFLQAAFARAEAIMAKPLDVQESLAHTILEASYNPQQAAVASAGGSNAVEARLGALGTPATASAAAEPEQREAATASSSDFDALLNSTMGSLGRR